MHSLLRSGFYARGLNADDHAFIAYVRQHGSANGELPHEGNGLVTEGIYFSEEQGFWNEHWAIETGVMRRLGTGRVLPPQVLEARRLARLESKGDTTWTQNEPEMRRARTAWKKEQKALALEREKRLQQAMLADNEWNRARREMLEKDNGWEKIGRYPRPEQGEVWRKRHYVPEWKRAELAAQIPPQEAPVAPVADLKRRPTSLPIYQTVEVKHLSALLHSYKREWLELRIEDGAECGFMPDGTRPDTDVPPRGRVYAFENLLWLHEGDLPLLASRPGIEILFVNSNTHVVHARQAAI